MIELAEARGLLARAVMTQGPDFVYAKVHDLGTVSCFYKPVNALNFGIPDDDPRVKTGCLIGVALELAGGNLQGVFEGAPPGNAANQAGLALGPRVAYYFSKAQAAQDQGSSWGDAWAAAEASVAETA